VAIYPVMWQVQCDSCGTTAKGAPGTGVQEVLMASVQQGWVLQAQAQAIPPTVLLCAACAARLAAIRASDGGNGAVPDEKILEHSHGEDS